MKIDKAKIKDFIREKVEIEKMTDAQIARLVGVGTSTVSHWRNKFNIKPANKFERKFREKYSRNGIDAIEQLDIMVGRGASYQAIADYFGFTRENARLVCIKRYGPHKPKTHP